MKSDQFIQSLRNELLQTQNIRFRLSIQKLVFIVGLLGVGSLNVVNNGVLTNLKYLLYFIPFVAFMFDIFIIGENFGIQRIGVYLKFNKKASKTERFWEFLLNVPQKKHRDVFAVHGNVYSTIVAIFISGLAVFTKIELETNQIVWDISLVNWMWLVFVSGICCLLWWRYPKMQNARLLRFMSSINKYQTEWEDIVREERKLLKKGGNVKPLEEALRAFY